MIITWLNPSNADESKVKARLTKIWEQIASRFKDYDEHLLFEGMNEPRIVGGQDEWTGGTEEEREVINNLFAAFVETVRKSGEIMRHVRLLSQVMRQQLMKRLLRV